MFPYKGTNIQVYTGCTCVDSITENCSTYPWSGRCSTPDGLANCPVTCNLCDQVRQLAGATNCPPVCADSNTSLDPNLQCSQMSCDLAPGRFYPNCRKTCNNCDGGKIIYTIKCHTIQLHVV